MAFPRLLPGQLDRYLERIGWSTKTRPPVNVDTLRRVHLGHTTHFPFENLSLHHPRLREQDQGRISVELPDIYDKLVLRHRGGYCYELNGLLSAALRELGFSVQNGAGRVVPPPPKAPMQGSSTGTGGEEGLLSGAPEPDQMLMLGLSHMIMFVTLDDGSRWLLDGGFGSGQPREPLPLIATAAEDLDTPCAHGQRLRRGVLGSRAVPQEPAPDDSPFVGWYLQSYSNARGWHDLYYFTTLPCTVADYRVFNYYTSTHPDSFFVKNGLLAYIRRGAGSASIFNGKLKLVEHPDSPPEEHSLASDEELDAALARYFGVLTSSA